jgi:hypothetical protein
MKAFKRLLISGDSFNMSQIPKDSRNANDSKLFQTTVVKSEHLRRFLIDVKKNACPCDDNIEHLFSFLDK